MKKKVLIGVIVAVFLGGGAAFGGWMYHNAKVDEMRQAGVEQLKTSVDMDAYREDQQKEIQKILDEGESAIMEAKDQESIDKIKANSARSIEGIKTALELDKEDAFAKLKKDYPLDKYRDNQKSEVEKTLSESEKKIADCSSKKDIDKIIKDAKATLDDVKTDEELTAEEEAAAAAADAARKKNNTKKKNNSNSGGCVGNDASNFY